MSNDISVAQYQYESWFIQDNSGQIVALKVMGLPFLRSKASFAWVQKLSLLQTTCA